MGSSPAILPTLRHFQLRSPPRDETSRPLPRRGMESFRLCKGWISSTVEIRLPAVNFKFKSEEEAPSITVNGLWHRDILDIVKEVYENQKTFAKTIHTTPFYDRFSPDGSSTFEGVYSEVMGSDDVLAAQTEINSYLRVPEDPPDIERIVPRFGCHSSCLVRRHFALAILCGGRRPVKIHSL